MPTFPWAVFQAAVPQHAVKKSNELLLNFAGNLYDLKAIPAREVFKWSEGEGFSENNYFYDKVVIIGNVFHTARDEHPTPIGTLPGVKLMAQAIESEMDGGGIHVMNDAYMLVLEILVGIGLVALNHFLTMGRALVVSVFAVFTVAPVCSFLAFSSFTMWMNFVPIIVAVLVHQLFDHANEYRRLYSELASHSATTPPEK